MAKVPTRTPSEAVATPSVELELVLGLGPDDASLVLAPGARGLDLQPWLLDCVAVRIGCLGHQEALPRAWDWENVLTLLEPGEELLYVLDHSRSVGEQNGRPFTLWLAVRFPRRSGLSSEDLGRRRKRVTMLVSQFRRQAFPGSDIDWVDPSEVHALLGFSGGSQPRCVCVSGLPSPRDLDDDRQSVERDSAARNGQSLNDVAETLVDVGCDYRIAFVVERVTGNALAARLGLATQLRDAIHPHVRGTTQLGGGRGVSQGSQESTSAGTNESTSDTRGSQHSGGIGVGIGGPIGAVIGFLNLSYNYSRSKSKTNTTGTSWTRTTGTNSGTSSEENWSSSQERLRSMLELSDRSLERTIAALHEAHGTGGYRWSAFVLADGENADLIGASLVGVLAGARTKDYPFNRFEVRGAGSELFLANDSLLDLVAEAAPILPLARACDALLLPEAELPGVRLRRNVFLGRNCSPPDDGQGLLSLGPDAFSALSGRADSDAVAIPRKDLFRHVLVAGATGSGKTTRVVEILNQLEDNQLSVIIFETAKRTYRRRLLRTKRPPPLVYALGSSAAHPGARFRPLRLNPFFFEDGTSLKRHIAVLSDALAELMPTEAMIGPLMRRAVEATYLERGWDIERGQPCGGLEPAWPTVVDFAAHVRQLAASLNYGPEVSANYRGALENRAALFVDATFQDIFNHDGNKRIDQLFPAGQDAIVEVEDLPPSEVDIRAFVMTLLLSRLRAVQAARSHALPGRRWLIVVEEAHNVLDRSFEVRRPADESNAGRTLLRCIDRLLQEGREQEIGVMVVDQSPVSLARSVISNTGTKIVMRLEDGAEMEEIGRAIGLAEDDWKKLGYLLEGEAIIKASYMDAPVKTAPFTKLSPSPAEGAPTGVGSSPSYVAMERLWRPTLAGAREPDAAWLSELLVAATDNVELAAFVGAKLQLESASGQGSAVDRTSGLRALVARHGLGCDELLLVARRLYAAAVASGNHGELVAVARLMFRALLQSAVVDPRLRVGGAAISRAAEILALAGIGETARWRLLLLGLVGTPGARSRTAAGQFERYCGSVGRGDVTVPVRVLLGVCAEAESGAASGGSPPATVTDPVEVVLAAQRLLEPVTAPMTGDAADPELNRRWRILVDHLTREAALALAAKAGPDVARQVLELFALGEMADD